MSRNEKFWVDQVTVPHPPPPWERQGVGNDKGGGGYCILADAQLDKQRHHKHQGKTQGNMDDCNLIHPIVCMWSLSPPPSIHMHNYIYEDV